jgi:membrane-associated phospholipid phosphatase
MTWKNLLEIDLRWSTGLRLPPARRVLFATFAFLAHSGDSWFWLAALAVIWLFDRSLWRSLSALMMIGIVVLAVSVLALKFAIRRQRPAGDWGAIYRSTDPHSFPSGHAARAAMLAVIAVGLGPAWFALLVVLWVPLVSLARVVMGVHYLSDVVAGVLVGILAGGSLLLALPLLTNLFPYLF